MFGDSEYMVISRCKELTNRFPFDNMDDAVVKAIRLTGEYPEATVEVGLWNGVEMEDTVSVSKARDDFKYLLEHTDESLEFFWYGFASSGKYCNKAAESIGDPIRVPEDHVVYVEDNNLTDLGSDWRSFAVFLVRRLSDVNLEMVCNRLDIFVPVSRDAEDWVVQ